MGDAAMAVPVLLAMAEQHPQVKITVLTKPFFQPIFNDVPNTQCYGADVKGTHKGIFGLYKLYKELKSLQINAVADLHNVLRSTILKQFFFIGGIKVVQIDKGRIEKKALTRENHKEFKQLTTTHERYADVFRQLGFSLQLSNKHILAKQPITETITQIVGNEAVKWIGIAPFAAFDGKTYPQHLMKEVVERLTSQPNQKILLFGGKGDIKALEELKHNHKNVVNLAGQLSFKDELALISNLDVMLSMDSGNAHLAAMYGVQTITLWGVTHPYAGFYPFAQPKENGLLADREQFPLIPTSVYGNKMPELYKNAMETITPDKVVKAVENALK